MTTDLLAAAFPWLLFALAFVAGGSVKGALGVGLPLVAMPLLSLGIPTVQAIALLAIPVLLSNLLQAAEGARPVHTLRRFGALIAAQFVATAVTVRLTLALAPAQLANLVALAVLLAVALMALRPTLHVDPARERAVGLGVGLLSGLLGGVSALMGPVVITYLVALRLKRDEFVGSISVIYLAGALPLYGTMALHGRIGAPELLLSTLALAPMAAGLWLGRAVRRHLDETLFRRILLAFLTLLAVLLLLK